jgi:hypothetical protein
MIDQMQNEHVELLAALARQGGGYDWRTVPISDSQGGEHSLMLKPYKAEVQEAPPFQGSQVGERIVQLLDKLSRKRKPRNDDDENDCDHSRETSKAYRKRVKAASSNDKRGAAFDQMLELAMPLSTEILQSWHGHLCRDYDAYGAAAPWFAALGGALQRIGAGKQYYQLAKAEKRLLASIVERIVSAEAA